MLGRRLDASLAELEIDGLRPYREGTSASQIHWPTVARRGEMLERRLVAELDSAPLVVLDTSVPDGEEALDKAVRAAASLCVYLGVDPTKRSYRFRRRQLAQIRQELTFRHETYGPGNRREVERLRASHQGWPG